METTATNHRDSLDQKLFLFPRKKIPMNPLKKREPISYYFFDLILNLEANSFLFIRRYSVTRTTLLFLVLSEALKDYNVN